MAGETNEIRRDIEDTRQEIDAHLQELRGQVRGDLAVQQRVQQNLGQVLTGAAVAGLAFGVLFGHKAPGRRSLRLAEEEARLAQGWKKLAKEQGRLVGTIEAEESIVP